MPDIDPAVFKEIVANIGVETIFHTMGISFVDKGHLLSFSSPFRTDKNPSCVYYKESGRVIDFAGDFSGNIYSLFREVTGESLIKAFSVDSSFLSDKAFEGNLRTYEKKDRTAFRKETDDRVVITGGALKEVMEVPMARYYCSHRRIAPETIAHFGIKVAEHSIANVNTFRNRLTIPIYNEYGALASLEGRALQSDPGEKKVLYPKGATTNLLFNFGDLDLSKPVIVVEGLMDLFQVWQAGYRNVSTTFGIQLTGIQIQQLTLIPDLILFPDTDDGGRQFVLNVEAAYPREFRIAFLEREGNDPGDASSEEIHAAMQNLSRSTEWLIDFFNLFETEESPDYEALI